MPLVTAAVISAGASIAGSAIANKSVGSASRAQTDATREAARIQQDYNNKALAAEREQETYARQQAAAQQAARAPYVQASNQAMATLADKLGLPAFNPSAVPPQIMPGGSASPMSLAQYMPGNTTPMRQPETFTPSRAPQGASLAAIAANGPRMMADDGSGMVTLVAPDGVTKRTVPREQAARFIARGARYV